MLSENVFIGVFWGLEVTQGHRQHSHSGDMLVGAKHLNGSRDHNHAYFRGGFFICLVRLNDIAFQCTKFDSSGLSHFSDMDGRPKFKMGRVT